MEENRTVWCGNLSDKVTEELLYELFLQAGPLEKVRIPKDRDGRQRTFAFITFRHECSVPYSIALFEGTNLYNKSLQLQTRTGSTNDSPQAGIGMNNSHGNERQRTQSLPIKLGNSPAPSSPLPDYNLLLQLGQQMFIPDSLSSRSAQLNRFSSFPPGIQSPMYKSQMNSSYYLGGNITKASKNARDNHGLNRNHPYRGGIGGGSASGSSRGHEYNHSNNGRHSNSDHKNSHHHRDNGHQGSGGRRRY